MLSPNIKQYLFNMKGCLSFKLYKVILEHLPPPGGPEPGVKEVTWISMSCGHSSTEMLRWLSFSVTVRLK